MKRVIAPIKETVLTALKVTVIECYLSLPRSRCLILAFACLTHSVYLNKAMKISYLGVIDHQVKIPIRNQHSLLWPPIGRDILHLVTRMRTFQRYLVVPALNLH